MVCEDVDVILISVQLGSQAGVQWWAGDKQHQNQAFQQNVLASRAGEIRCSLRVLSYVTAIKSTLHVAESLFRYS